MTRHVTYEWDVETVRDEPGFDDADILDHHHADKLREFPADVLEADEATETIRRLVLVRDDDNIGGDRLWAYVRPDGTLPEFFADAWNTETDVRVPKRFIDELRQWWESRS